MQVGEYIYFDGIYLILNEANSSIDAWQTDKAKKIVERYSKEELKYPATRFDAEAELEELFPFGVKILLCKELS